MTSKLMQGIYAKLAERYPDRPYGGKRPASSAQKSAARANPWLAHLKKIRAQLKKEGIQMTPPEVAKFARASYAKGSGRKPRGGAILGGSPVGGRKTSYTRCQEEGCVEETYCSVAVNYWCAIFYMLYMFSFKKPKGGRRIALTPELKVIWLADPFAIKPTAKLDQIERAFGGAMPPELKTRVEEKLEVKRRQASGLFDDYKVTGEGAMLKMWQETPDQRDVVYVTAPSGSGKSWWCAGQIRMYKAQFPTNKVYVFSRVKEDPVIDAENVQRVVIDEKFVAENFPLEAFSDSLCLFDDTQTLPKGLKEPVQHLLSDALEVGRHHRISLLVTSHNATDYARTRLLLTEATGIVVFPRGAAFKGLEYLCRTYMGMTLAQVHELRALPSRWVYLSKSAPMFVLHEKGMYALR